MADVAPVVHSFEVNIGHGGIGAAQGLHQVVADGGYAQHASAAGDDAAVLDGGAGMEDFNAGNARGGIEAGDGKSGFVAAGITGRAGDDACRRALSSSAARFQKAGRPRRLPSPPPGRFPGASGWPASPDRRSAR